MNRARAKRLLGSALLPTCAALAACEADPWVIGSERVPDADEPSIGASGASAGGLEPCDDVSALAERRATWGAASALSVEHIGYWRGSLSGGAAEAFPSLDVALVLLPDGSGSLSFESIWAPPGPDGSELGYLCDGSVSGGVCGSESGFVGGFDYPLEAVTSRASILSFSIVDGDPWASWCALQEPVGQDDPFVACGTSFSPLPPGVKFRSSLGCELMQGVASVPIDCDRMYSLAHCQCARDGCVAAFSSSIEVGLSLSTGLDELSGSLWFKDETDAAWLSLRRQ